MSKRTKVIAFGLPMYFMDGDDGVPELHGIFSGLYTAILAPIDAFFNGGIGFYFMEYEGPYLRALWHYLFGESE